MGAHPDQFIGNVTQNVKVAWKDIRAELALSYANYLAEEWHESGRELGMALRRALVGLPEEKPISFEAAKGTYCAGIFPQGNVPKFQVTANMTVRSDPSVHYTKPVLDYHYHEDVFGHSVRMDCDGETDVDFNDKTGKLDVSRLFANKTDCMAIAVGQDPSHLSALINHVQFDGEYFHWTNGWGVQKYWRIPDGESCPFPPQEDPQDLVI